MANEIEVVVDGVIYELQSYGGISRIYNEILPRICSMDSSLWFRLLMSRRPMQVLPTHVRIKHCFVPQIERYLYPKNMWNAFIPTAKRLTRQLLTGTGKRKIWHSTYYTMPEEWYGFSVVTVVDMIYERFPDLFNGTKYDQFRETRRRCIQESDAVMCISEITRQDVQNFCGINSKPIYVVPLACSDVFRKIERQEGSIFINQPFLLFVGDRQFHKNFDVLIQAYSIWSQRKDIALVFVGKPWSNNEKRHLAELGIEGYTQLFSNIDDKVLCGLYNQALALVYPSLYEGFGIPLLEAMACGCPIIASRIPSTIEVAGECPIYFEPTNVEDLINAFNIVLSEGNNSGRVKSGIKRALSYSWDKTATQVLRIYRDVSN